MASILIADDHDLIREGIKTILRTHAEYHLVGEAVNGEEAAERVKALRPDVLLLDLSMPERTGLDVIEQVHRLSPATKIIVVTVHRSPLYMKKAMAAGIDGYLHKDNAAEDLLPALRRVVGGGTYVSAAVAKSLTEQAQDGSSPDTPEPALTARETDVVRLVVEGKTAKEIAQLLFISPRTVEHHKEALLKKLGLSKTSELIRYAITHRLVDVEEP